MEDQIQQVETIEETARALVSELLAAGKTLSTAESCTGGWISKALTDVAGSSGCFGYGIVSYSFEAKQSLLGVAESSLREHGAVSEPVVRQMAAAVMKLSGSDEAVAVSGIAGPGGGTVDKPVGTVWFGWASRVTDGIRVEAVLHRLTGDREAIRRHSVLLALSGVRQRLKAHG